MSQRPREYPLKIDFTRHFHTFLPEINLPVSTSDSVSYIHLSPSGFHAIVSCKSGENFYLHLKGHVVTAALKKIKVSSTRRNNKVGSAFIH